jgi:hypothetical protein
MNSFHWLIIEPMIIFKKFKEIQKFVSPKKFVYYSKNITKDDLINQNLALLEMMKSFPKEDKRHKEAVEKMKEIQKELQKYEIENEISITKASWKEQFGLFAICSLGVAAMVFKHYKRLEENKRREEEQKKKYPKSD